MYEVQIFKPFLTSICTSYHQILFFNRVNKKGIVKGLHKMRIDAVDKTPLESCLYVVYGSLS